MGVFNLEVALCSRGVVVFLASDSEGDISCVDFPVDVGLLVVRGYGGVGLGGYCRSFVCWCSIIPRERNWYKEVYMV